MPMKTIAIIGAGVSGLSCARRLNGAVNVHVFDKSRGVAGRMSTRYTDEFEFDHGAQYFTARHPDFRAEIITAIENGHAAPWIGRAFYKKALGIEPDIGADRFTAVPRMNSWAKALAAGLNVNLSTRISAINKEGRLWTLSSEDGHEFRGYHGIVLAIPAPQAEALLSPSFSKIKAVKQTQMDACFALMLGFDDLPDLGWDSLRVENGPCAWIAMNSHKPERAKLPAIMVHSAADWSNAHANDDRDDIAKVLLKAASEATDYDLSVAKYTALHRWLYASVSTAPNEGCLYDKALNLAVCGDWCLGGRVENAFLSGRAAAKAILDAL